MAAEMEVEDEGSLSTGTIENIIVNNQKNLPAECYLQVLDVKEAQPNKYSARLHDEKHFVGCFFNSKFSAAIKGGEIKTGTIIELKSFNLMDRSNVKFMMLLDFDVIQSECDVLGASTNIYLAPGAKVPKAAPAEIPPKFGNSTNTTKRSTAITTNRNMHSGGGRYVPLSALNPFNGNPSACIKVRVSAKNAIRTWDKNGKTGKLFSFDIIDAAGDEMKVTAFNDECDKFVPEIHVDNVYTIKNFYIKHDKYVQKRYKTDYAITLKRNTEISAVNAGDNFAQKQYDFQTIQTINELQVDDTSNKKTYVDVIAIVRNVGEITKFTSRKQVEYTKRELTLVDTTNFEIQATLWGNDAENNTEDKLPTGSVVLFTGSSVSTFGGKSLSGGSFKTGQNIEHLPEYGALLEFWSSFDSNTVQKIQAQARTYQNDLTTWKGAEVENKGHAMGRENFKGDYFDINGCVSFLSYRPERENFYMAGGERGKKVSQENGVWMDNQGTEYDEASVAPRYMIRAKFSDSTGSQYVTFIGDKGDIMMNLSCEEYKALHVGDDIDEKVNNAHREAYFRPLTVSIRASEDHWNGEVRQRYMVQNITEMDYLADAKRLYAHLSSISQTV